MSLLFYQQVVTYFPLTRFVRSGEGDTISSPLLEGEGEDLGLMIHIPQGQDFVLTSKEKKVK